MKTLAKIMGYNYSVEDSFLHDYVPGIFLFKGKDFRSYSEKNKIYEYMRPEHNYNRYGLFYDRTLRLLNASK